MKNEKRHFTSARSHARGCARGGPSVNLCKVQDDTFGAQWNSPKASCNFGAQWTSSELKVQYRAAEPSSHWLFWCGITQFRLKWLFWCSYSCYWLTSWKVCRYRAAVVHHGRPALGNQRQLGEDAGAQQMDCDAGKGQSTLWRHLCSSWYPWTMVMLKWDFVEMQQT